MLNPSELTKEIMALPIAARMDLLDSIEASLEAEYAALTGFGLHAQEQLMEQRLTDALSGKLAMQPVAEALDEIRKSL